MDIELPTYDPEGLSPTLKAVYDKGIFTEEQLFAILTLLGELQTHTINTLNEEYLAPVAESIEIALQANSDKVKHYVVKHRHDETGESILKFEDL